MHSHLPVNNEGIVFMNRFSDNYFHLDIDK